MKQTRHETHVMDASENTDTLLLVDEQSSLRRLRARSLAGILGIAALLGMGGLFIFLFILRTPADTQVINLAGKQRAFSQSLVHEAVAIQLAEPEARPALLDSFEAILNDWREDFDALSAQISTSSPEVRQLHQEIAPGLEAITDAASCVLQLNARAADFSCEQAENEYLNAIYLGGDQLTLALDAFLADYIQRSNDSFRQVRTAILSLLFGTIVILGFVHYRALLPAINKAEESYNRVIRTRDRLSESETQFRYMAENIDEAFWIVSADEQALYYVNPAYRRITGRSAQSLSQDPTSWTLNLHPDDLERVLTVIAESPAAGYEVEYRLVRPGGEVRWVYHRLRRIINARGDVLLSIGVAMDITERRLFEHQLLRARDAAESASRTKSAFLANVSHELRTPLNAIIGFAQLGQSDPALSDNLREILGVIMSSGEHLLTLINEVLDISRIEAGKVSFRRESFDLYGMLDELRHMFGLSTQNKDISFTIECDDDVPRYIQTDHNKLRQVLINLLANAIKFTDDGGVILRVSRAQSGETLRLVFEVEDTGTGITPKDMDTLFDPFVRSEHSRSQEEGTGLGLPISQRYVQMLGGRIDVQSTVGQGSVFSFRIPVILGGRPDKQRLPERQVIGLAPDQPVYRVLVVDDNAESRILIERLLSPLGFQVWSTASGIEGVQMAHEWEPHVIMMDMRMPNMDGYEAARRIRSTSKGQRVIIIGFTAGVLEQRRTSIIAAGCNDVLRKPFRANELYDLLVQHLGVQFAYDVAEVDVTITDTNETVAVGEINTAMLAQLPVAWRADLRQASIEGDVERVQQLINVVRSAHHDLADKLSVIAADFEFDRILELLE